MPKVSIVLPVYNGEKYLEDALVSISSQSFYDWELIVIDDCSSDSTPEIVRKFEAADSRIRYFRNSENLKLPASLNKGFSFATGDYHTWTSDDNLLEKDAISIMVDFLDRNSDCSLVYANQKVINQDGQVIGETGSLNSTSLIYFYNVVGACFLYRAEVFNHLDGYATDLFLVEDYDFWLRAYRDYKIRHIDKTLYRYRVHGASLSGTREKEIRRKTCDLLARELGFTCCSMWKRVKLLVGISYNKIRYFFA